jgi:SAM-dependent methyltransferase
MGSDLTAHEVNDGRRYAGCAIPPDVHSVGFGWDPQPEVNRLLHLARIAGVNARSALELGCGTGRLLESLRTAVPDVVALDLSPAVVEFARSRSRAEVIVADMSDFSLNRRFDLIYTSANTIRHVCDLSAVQRMWSCIGEHLSPGGVFIADLELGIAAEAARVGKPAIWEISRGPVLVKVNWEVVKPPSLASPLTGIRWTFESRGGESPGVWSEMFQLRAYDAPGFVVTAQRHGRLDCIGIHEPRDPYLVETPAEKAVGRMLVVFQSAG